MKKGIGAIIAIIFGILIVMISFSGISFLANHYYRVSIINNGKQAVASIEDVVRSDNTNSDDERLYYIKYKYYNPDLEKNVWGKTQENYTASKISIIEAGGIIKIYYLPNGDSVEYDYLKYNSPVMSWIMMPIFLICGLCMVIFGFRAYGKAKLEKNKASCAPAGQIPAVIEWPAVKCTFCNAKVAAGEERCPSCGANIR